jgi:hypothetical protein
MPKGSEEERRSYLRGWGGIGSLIGRETVRQRRIRQAGMKKGILGLQEMKKGHGELRMRDVKRRLKEFRNPKQKDSK